MYQLIIEKGRQVGQCVRPRTTKFTIGRDQDNHLRLSEDGVSGRHCVLRIGREGITIRDLGSTNGTCVNDELIREETRIPGGAHISVGAVRLRFEFVHDTDRHKRRMTAMFWMAVMVVAATFALQFAAVGIAVWMHTHKFSRAEITALQKWFPPLPPEELEQVVSSASGKRATPLTVPNSSQTLPVNR